MPNTFLQKNKLSLLTLALLLSIAGVSGYLTFSPSQVVTKTVVTSQTQVDAVPEAIVETSETNVATFTESGVIVKRDEVPIKTGIEIEKETETKTGIEIGLEVEGEKYVDLVKEGDSVYDLMLSLRDQGLQFEAKDFGDSLGYFIESINGKKSDHKNGYYWIFYVNGQKSQIGVSNYFLKSNDLITWKYEKSEI